MAIFDYSSEAELSPTAGEVGHIPHRQAADAAAHRVRTICQRRGCHPFRGRETAT
jgi:predicted NBD/HSP70 family sugar kinase